MVGGDDMSLYYDGWLAIELDAEHNRAIIADSVRNYAEVSIPVAKYITERLMENFERGYHLIDLVFKRRAI